MTKIQFLSFCWKHKSWKSMQNFGRGIRNGTFYITAFQRGLKQIFHNVKLAAPRPFHMYFYCALLPLEDPCMNRFWNWFMSIWHHQIYCWNVYALPRKTAFKISTAACDILSPNVCFVGKALEIATCIAVGSFDEDFNTISIEGVKRHLLKF